MNGAGGESGSALRADDLQEIVATVDGSLHIVSWNLAGAEITGFGRDATIGRDLADLFEDGSRRALDGLVAVLRSGGTNPPVELRLKTRYGHAVEVEVTAYAAREGSAPADMTFVMRDVTLRNLLEERRTRLEPMFRTLVESAPALIYITDAAGRVQFINTAARRILGYDPRDLRGCDIAEIVHPEDRETAYWPLRERRTGARATSGVKVRFLKKQRGERAMELDSVVFSLTSIGLYFTPAQGQADLQYSGTEGFAQDITDFEHLREFEEQVGNVIPICSTCRRVKIAGPEGDTWVKLEEYVRRQAHADLSHSYCPDCLRRIQEA